MNAELSILYDTAVEVSLMVLPVLAFFLLFQFFFLGYPRVTFNRIMVNLLLATLGIFLFLGGVYMGLMPAAQSIGEYVGSNLQRWYLPLMGAVVGFLATFAEPTVRLLSDQVDRSSSGYLPSKVLVLVISLGVAFTVALGMARIAYGWDFIYIIVPGYLLAMMFMWRTSPKFVSMAFDSGGMVTGPLAVFIVMSMAIGAASGIEGASPIRDGFGMIAMIALAPLKSISALGNHLTMKEGEYDN